MTKKAFTLIELLVVIAIIALLLAIIVPSLRAVKEYASVVNCLSSQKNIALAYIMYTADNDDKFCSGYIDNTLTPSNQTPMWVKPPLVYTAGGMTLASDAQLNTETRTNGLREGALFPYLEDVKVFHCPGDKRLRKGAARYFTDTSPQPLNVYQIYRSYGMPDFYRADRDEDDELLLSNIKAGGSKLLFVEDQYDKWYNVDGWSYQPGRHQLWDPLGDYHNDSCTFAFVDGHAEHYKWRDKRTSDYMANRLGDSPIQRRTTISPHDVDLDWLDHAYPYKTRFLDGQN